MQTRPILLLSALLVLAACEDKPEPPLAPTVDPAAVPTAAKIGAGKDKVRVLVRLESRANAAAVADQALAGGGKVIRQFRRYPLLALEIPVNALQGLQHMKGVVSIAEDVPDRPTLDNSLPVINADDVRALGWKGSGYTVVILDTGIDTDHPFFGSRIVAQACFSSGDVSLCPDGSDEQTGGNSANATTAACLDGSTNICSHGTHVAGIAAGDGTGVLNAPAAGVAPAANIIAIQVFSRDDDDDDCDGDAPCVTAYQSDQIAALEYVLDELADDFAISSINMSLGSGMYTENCDDDDRKDVIDDLRAINIATVIAAGNDSYGDAVGRPGCISTAITIGSTDNSDNISSFSNRGSLLELFAPGTGIRSSVPDNSYDTYDGTSMATPHVAGAWAVLRGATPAGTSVSTILGFLQTTGVPIANGSGTTPRIDLAAALRATTQPPVLTVANATVTVDEGQTASNTGTFSDDEGSPVTLTASVGTVTETSPGNWSWSYATTDGPAQTQVVTITGTDNKGAAGTKTFQLTVQNVTPIVNAGLDASIVSNQNFDFYGKFSDPGIYDALWKWSIDWGDGSAPTLGNTSNQFGTIARSHQYCEAKSYTVTFKVKDKDLAEGSDALTLTVNYFGVTIDITPAQFPNSISLSNKGLQPVALLSTATFDARQANPSKVTLGDGTGTETPVAQRTNNRYYADVEDVNRDGRPDVIFKFSVPALVANGDLTAASTVLYLTGYLADGCTNFRGSDSIRPTP